jgi:RimJ/RimL family protein N-acetyltransferase
LGDRRDLQQYWTDPEQSQYQLWDAPTAEQVEASLDEQVEISPGDPGVPLILGAEVDGKVVGDCQLTVTSVGDRQAEVGFRINPRFAGRSLATRTVAAVLGFGFVQLGLHRVEAVTDVRNKRSWRLMERVGMWREGHIIHGTFVRGEWADYYLYAILDIEWQQHHPDLANVVAL